MLYRTTPNLSEVQPWGCKVWVHDDNRSKLDACTHEGQWLGFDIDTWAHRVFWLNSGTVSVEQNMYFDLQSGKGITSLNLDLHVSGAFIEDPEESGGAWAVEDGLPTLLEDFSGMEFIFIAETADVEALKPHTLAEARECSKWPQWVTCSNG